MESAHHHAFNLLNGIGKPSSTSGSAYVRLRWLGIRTAERGYPVFQLCRCP